MNTAPGPQASGDPGTGGVFRRGDHLRAGRRGGYHHDGIYLGNGQVIHLTGNPGGGKASARVRIDPLEAFASGGPVTIRPYAGDRNPDVIIARALSQVGEGGYHLLFNNCQHFARWCATGNHVSEQVDAAAATASTAVTQVAAASAGINLVGSAGLVSGLSGPGIMSGLASYGALIGGGAVAGMMVLGTGPALTSVAIMRRALREDEDLPEAERAARTAGRRGSAAGAVAGSLGSVAIVSALGVPGLSATGISSGLAAIGATFGGGMAAGTMAVVAAPAITAAFLGYLMYKLGLWWLESGPLPTNAIPPQPSQ